MFSGILKLCEECHVDSGGLLVVADDFDLLLDLFAILFELFAALFHDLGDLPLGLLQGSLILLLCVCTADCQCVEETSPKDNTRKRKSTDP